MSGRNSRENDERDFERCLERCEDQRDRDEEDEDNRSNRREIERDFDRCKERCEESLIRDERRDAELEADLDLSIHSLYINGSATIEYADIRDDRGDEVEIKYRIEGPTSCNDCKLAIVDDCKLASVDDDSFLDLDGDGYCLLDTAVDFGRGESRGSLDF